MKSIDTAYIKINREQITNTTDYFNELLDQFSLDCSPEDLKEDPEARKCFKQLKSLGRQIKAVNNAEKRLFSIQEEGMKSRVIFLDYDGVVNTPMWNSKGTNCRYGWPSDGKVNNFQAVHWDRSQCWSA